MKKATLLSILLSQISFVALLPIYLNLFTYLHLVVIVVVWFCQTFLTIFIIFYFYKMTIKVPAALFNVIFLLYSLGLLILLFFRPTQQNYHNWNLVPFTTISFYLSGDVPTLVATYNLAANIGLFIPFGIFLMLKNRSATQLISIPLVGISLIEITQFSTHRGSLDIDDLILNILGVFIGYFLYPVFKKVITVKKMEL